MRGKDLSEFGTKISKTMKHTLKEYSFDIKSALGTTKALAKEKTKEVEEKDGR